MDIIVQKMNKEDVESLLLNYDKSFVPPLNKTLDISNYSIKLSNNAYFIIVYDNNEIIGFTAYYLNIDYHFIYVPLTVVSSYRREEGIGHKMFSKLIEMYKDEYLEIQLEVLKENHPAIKFYSKEGFIIVEDRDTKYLLIRHLHEQ